MGDGALVWVARRKALLDFWLGWIVAMVHKDVTYDNKLWKPCAGGQFG